MFGLSFGEMFVVTFVTVMVVSARYWPAIGERIAVRLSRPATEPATAPKPAASEAPRE